MIYATRFEIFLLRKNYCVHCGNLLNRKKIIRIIDGDSEEASHYGISGGEGGFIYSTADIRLTTYCLECKICNKTFTVKEQRVIAKAQREARKVIEEAERREQRAIKKAQRKRK